MCEKCLIYETCKHVDKAVRSMARAENMNRTESEWPLEYFVKCRLIKEPEPILELPVFLRNRNTQAQDDARS